MERVIVRIDNDGAACIVFADVDTSTPAEVCVYSEGSGTGYAPWVNVRATTRAATEGEANAALASYCASYGRKREKFRLCKRLNRW